ncbi:MAG: hypothetical protein AAF696_32850, partial [Bacteroidota bacterium]
IFRSKGSPRHLLYSTYLGMLVYPFIGMSMLVVSLIAFSLNKPIGIILGICTALSLGIKLDALMHIYQKKKIVELKTREEGFQLKYFHEHFVFQDTLLPAKGSKIKYFPGKGKKAPAIALFCPKGGKYYIESTFGLWNKESIAEIAASLEAIYT